MKTTYRGHEIDAHREKCLAGYSLLYFSVFRESDGYECTSGFTTGSDTPREFVEHLKGLVDKELLSEDPWGENAPFTPLPEALS